LTILNRSRGTDAAVHIDHLAGDRAQQHEQLDRSDAALRQAEAVRQSFDGVGFNSPASATFPHTLV